VFGFNAATLAETMSDNARPGRHRGNPVGVVDADQIPHGVKQDDRVPSPAE
jgi:hypothetical protein